MNKIGEQNSIIARALLEDQLAQNNALLKSKLDQLNSAVQRQGILVLPISSDAYLDAQKSADLLKDIIDATNRRTELGRKLANEVKDPQLKSQIVNAADKLENQLPELAAATKSALQNPSDDQASQRFPYQQTYVTITDFRKLSMT